MPTTPIPYINGGESPTKELMNSLFTGLESKMLSLFLGKSFLLGQFQKMPWQLTGKGFFFTNGIKTVYAQNVLGNNNCASTGILDSAGDIVYTEDNCTPINYNHTIFTTQATTSAGLVTSYDTTNKIANIPVVPNGAYGSIPVDTNVGFFEHSLARHFTLHQGTGDSSPVPYYFQEAKNTQPEKYNTYALAEILIEGTSSVSIPNSWDKYGCFRVHNLQTTTATITFGSTTSTLQPFDCHTFRRNLDGTVSSTGMHYFFPYEDCDPRSYWYLPTQVIPATSSSPSFFDTGKGRDTVANSMTANNLMNPAILFDWVDFLQTTGTQHIVTTGQLLDFSMVTGLPFWNVDTTLMKDIHGYYTNYFGDPANTSTIFGDLIHHRGNLTLIRASKTLTDPSTGNPVTTVETLRFNGYATIASDFGARQIHVAEDTNGNLVLTNADPLNFIALIPNGTNLLSKGETCPSIWWLDANRNNGIATGQGPFTIESAILENPVPLGGDFTQDFVLGASNQILKYTDTSTPDTRAWIEVLTNTLHTVSGSTIPSVSSTIETGAIVHGIHKLTVGDILNLTYWEDKTGTGAVFTSPALTLTWEGPVLTYTRTLTDGSSAFIKRKFRGHGFGYQSAVNGYMSTMWLSPRADRLYVTGGIQNDDHNVAGADFTLTGLTAPPPYPSNISVITRLKARGWYPSINPPPGMMTLGDGQHRFMHTNHVDAIFHLMGFMPIDTPTKSILFWNAIVLDTLSTWVAPATNPVAMPLLPEQFNAMAAYINSVTTGNPVTTACLRWRLSNGHMAVFPPPGSNSLAIGSTQLPVPINQYCGVPTSSDVSSLMTLLSIPVKTESDFPSEWATYKTAIGYNPIIVLETEQTINRVTSFNSTTAGQDNWNTVAIRTRTADYLEPAALLANTPPGNRCLGVWNSGVEPARTKFTIPNYAYGIYTNPNNGFTIAMGGSNYDASGTASFAGSPLHYSQYTNLSDSTLRVGDYWISNTTGLDGNSNVIISPGQLRVVSAILKVWKVSFSYFFSIIGRSGNQPIFSSSVDVHLVQDSQPGSRSADGSVLIYDGYFYPGYVMPDIIDGVVNSFYNGNANTAGGSPAVSLVGYLPQLVTVDPGYQNANLQRGLAQYNGTNIDTTQIAQTYKWITISDVQSALSSFGLDFLYYETSIPLSYEHFSDVTLHENQFSFSRPTAQNETSVHNTPLGQSSYYIDTNADTTAVSGNLLKTNSKGYEHSYVIYSNPPGFASGIYPYFFPGIGAPAAASNLRLALAQNGNLARQAHPLYDPSNASDLMDDFISGTAIGIKTINQPSMLQFCPTFDPTKAKWKAPLTGKAQLGKFLSHTSSHNPHGLYLGVDNQAFNVSNSNVVSNWANYPYIMTEFLPSDNGRYDLREGEPLYMLCVQIYTTLSLGLLNTTATITHANYWNNIIDYWISGAQSFYQYWLGESNNQYLPVNSTTTAGDSSISFGNGTNFIQPLVSPATVGYWLVGANNSYLISL